MTATAMARAATGELLTAMVVFWPSYPWERLAIPRQNGVVQQWSDTLQTTIVPTCAMQTARVPFELGWITIDASRLANCMHDECAQLAQPSRAVFVGLMPPDTLDPMVANHFASFDPYGHLLVVRHDDVLSLLNRGSFRDVSVLQVSVLLGPGVL